MHLCPPFRRYGLASTVWTTNLERAHRFSRQLDSGIVWVNSWLVRDLSTPFGGVKDSGVGREGGRFVFNTGFWSSRAELFCCCRYSLEFFSETKNIYIHLPMATPPKV
jgi:aminomuconate-semialdehyde/2-hydroxymuconate-6-semialdehyde dehydrogenase